MTFKYLPLLLSLWFLSINQLTAQENKLIAPEGWRPEEIKLPLSFAPEIDISGIEEVRFAPGWGKADSEEYFSYAFVWFLDDPKDLNKEDLAHFLVAYFDGIMGMVGGYDEVGTTAKLAQNGDKFQGALTTKDGFFTKGELNLNFTIEKLDQGSIWFFRLSPQPMDHYIWLQLKEEVRIED